MIRTRVGYAGGAKDKPTYHSLGGHTEALQLEFDPKTISYEKLLEIFWGAHDPFSAGGSTQYKAVLWTHGDAQARLAKASAEALAKKSGRDVRTEIRPATMFWIAEDYHQKYRLRSRAGLLVALLGLDATNATKVRDSTIAARANGWLAGHGTKAEITAEVEALGLDEHAREALEAALGSRAPVLCK